MPDALPALGSLTLTQLGYLVAVDRHRHFGLAAAACHVTQPTLSMQLRKLERALGVTLFDRSRSPVVPTDVGRLLAEQARVVLREAARLGDLRDAAAGAVAGELRLGVIPTIAPYLLPRVVPELVRRHPGLQLVVEERVTDDVLDRLRHDALDAGLVATPVPGPELLERPLFHEPFVGYVSAGHRLADRQQLSPADLSLDDLWLLAEGHCIRTQTVALCEQHTRRGTRGAGSPAGRAAAATASCTLAARFESGNLETLKRLVEGGTGMTLLPALAAAYLRAEAQRRLLRPFVAPAPSRLIRLVKRRAYLRQHLVRAVVEVLLDTLPPELQPTPAAPKPARPGRRRAPR